MNKIRYLIVHHSETKDGVVKDWDAIRTYHTKVRGWRDIGYHFGIERVKGDVVLHAGRPVNVDGAHCKEGGMNTKSLGICVVGNFNAYPPDAEMLDCARLVVQDLMAEYAIPVENVLGHAEAQKAMGYKPTKTCPGVKFDMDAFRASLEDTDEPAETVEEA